jgi:bacillolysin
LEAHNKAGLAFNAFAAVFSRNSWDGAGGIIRLATNYGNDLGNGYSAPGGWLMFANGEAGQLSAAEDLDAVTHEYTHGIVGNRLGLINVNGPVDGAPSLNEGFADWGATVSNVYIQGFPSPATWQIGAQDPTHPLDGLRNLQFPISEDLFARDWFPSRTEALGAASRYRNSTIMGHAFYLLASSGPAQHYRAGIPGSGVPVIPVAGLGYEAARNIFYYSMFTGVLNNTATFFSLRSATLAAALPTQQASVQQAWQAVGLSYNCTSAPQTPQIQVWPAYCLGKHKITWNPVPGATTYDGQATPVVLGWGLAQTITDGNVNECKQNIPPNTGDWWVRVRACNGCGCSGWSPQGMMEYWYTCQ